ncbi:hypothetical protein LJC45_06085, partial [Alistipes sp. OttesenSCG-928-B03]|nr:hypothetical protein [Alistipes sp. OttesenSCG-928-B03]
GKIYAKPPYIFINERYKGVHVIDNSNPEDPEQIGFIVAPGCVDMAVKGDIMYLDNAVDLVAFDLTQKKVTERIRNIFPEHRAPNGDSYYGYRDRDMILVGWRTANNN